MPAMPLDSADIYSWARFGLTGDPFSETPTLETLAFIADTAIGSLFTDWPCLQGTPGELATDVSGDAVQQKAFSKAAGYYLAAEIVLTPAGRMFAGNVVRTKVGNVERTRQEVDVQVAADNLRIYARQALLQIPSIAGQVGTLTLYGRAGRSIEDGNPRTVYDQAFGKRRGDDGELITDRPVEEGHYGIGGNGDWE